MNDTDPSDETQNDPDTQAMPTDSTPTTDDRQTTADSQPTTDGGETASTSTPSTAESDETGRNVARYVNYAVLGGLCLLAFIAAIQFYLSTSQAINTWVTREYRSLFQAAFNLVVVLLAGTGIAFQLRRLYGE
jgi:hypothetical protein